MWDAISAVMNSFNDFLWGWFMIILLLGTHIFLTIRTKFVQRKTFKAIKLSVTKDPDSDGDISPFQALATALASNPKLLIADEPTTALDLYYKESLHQWMKTYQQKNGIILMTTHDESEIRNADRCLFMDEGKVQELDAEDILQKFAGMSE